MAVFNPLPDSQICLLSAAAGALSHWAYFMHGEHHLYAALYFRLSIFVPVLAALALWNYTDLEFTTATILTSKAVASYSAALWTSILTYRIFLHPLKSFPGPWMAKTSKLWHMWILSEKSDNFRRLEGWHQKYGDFVRTGESSKYKGRVLFTKAWSWLIQSRSERAIHLRP